MANTSTDLKSGISGELGVKAPCRVASLVNITLSGEQTINGVAVVDGDIILVTGQTDTTENGVYVASTSAWARAVWFDDELDVIPGTLVVSVEGSLSANTLWKTASNTNPIVFGTSLITFTFFAEAGAGALLIANNLSDVANVATSRANLDAQQNIITTRGDLIRGDAAGAAERLAVGTSGQFLTNDGTDTSWGSLPVSSATTAGIVELLTNAELATGTDTTRAATAANLLSLFSASSQAVEGYARIPINIGGAFDEIIIQWGILTTAPTPATSYAVVFPITFPNAVLHTSYMKIGTYSGGGTANNVITTRSTTGFSLTHGDIAALIGYEWFSIGY